jgi:TusA-related sulfurtransferase
MYCPEPLFKTRQGIDEIEINEILKLQADDPAAEEDIKRFCKRTGHKLVDIKENNGVFTFLIERTK